MSVCISILVAIILFGNCSSSLAQTISAHKTGETLTQWPTNEPNQKQFLFFLERSSCWTCELALNHFLAIAARNNVNAVIFLADANADFVQEYKRANQLTCQVVADPIRAYAKNYGVLFFPSFYLLSESSELLAFDKIAGQNVSMDSIELTVQSNKHSQVEILDSRLVLEQESNLHTKTGIPESIGKKIYLVEFSDSRRIAILDGNLKRILIADKSGEIQHVHPLGQVGVRTPVVLFWDIQDSILAFLDMNPLTLNSNVFKLNLMSGEVIQFPYETSAIPSDTHILKLTRNTRTNIYTAAISPRAGDSTFSSQQSTIGLFDTFGHFIRAIGRPDSFATTIPSMFQARQFAYDSSGNIYEIQEPTGRINVYDPSGELQYSSKIRFGSSYKPLTTDLTGEKDNTFWVTLNSNTSWVTGLFINAHDEIAVAYCNSEYSKNDAQAMTPSAIKYFLHLENIKSSSLPSTEVEFPVGVKPYIVNRNKILAGRIVNGQLRLYSYRILP